MPDPKSSSSLEEGIDVAINILTKSNALAAIATVAASGLIALFKKHGVPVPDVTPEELNAQMLESANTVVENAQDLKAKIRAEFNLPTPPVEDDL